MPRMPYVKAVLINVSTDVELRFGVNNLAAYPNNFSELRTGKLVYLLPGQKGLADQKDVCTTW